MDFGAERFDAGGFAAAVPGPVAVVVGLLEEFVGGRRRWLVGLVVEVVVIIGVVGRLGRGAGVRVLLEGGLDDGAGRAAALDGVFVLLRDIEEQARGFELQLRELMVEGVDGREDRVSLRRVHASSIGCDFDLARGRGRMSAILRACTPNARANVDMRGVALGENPSPCPLPQGSGDSLAPFRGEEVFLEGFPGVGADAHPLQQSLARSGRVIGLGLVGREVVRDWWVCTDLAEPRSVARPVPPSKLYANVRTSWKAIRLRWLGCRAEVW